MSETYGPPPRMQPLVALRALKLLIQDPQRTEEVFVIIRALSGKSIDRSLRRFKRLPLGRRVLKEREVLLGTLMDKQGLAEQSSSSLASAYLRFITDGELTADGLVDASELENAAGKEVFASADHKLFSERLRDQHDLWHTLMGYGRDELGEVCLLAFTYAQTPNRGIGLMALVGMFKMTESYGSDVFLAVWRAYRDGKRAAWLPGQDWRALLGEPIEAVRDKLSIGRPERYTALLEPAAA